MAPKGLEAAGGRLSRALATLPRMNPLPLPDPACDELPPSSQAAHARLRAVRPHDYARSRNHLEGAVTRLSPYISHGVLTLPQVLAQVQEDERARDAKGRGLPPEHKFINELAWREYFHHVWQHEGKGIFASLHEGPMPESSYARVLPEDIRQGRTGVPVIDQALRELYATGYLHNHARMWLASYVVHLRKVHWRAGADWLYGHLLDGDLASNHLSWQWVAGTGSHKPYLFNAGNVEKFAPGPWHSRGSVVDASYEALEAVARSGKRLERPGRVEHAAVQEPPLLNRPPFDVPTAKAGDLEGAWLMHPWNLRAPEHRSQPVVGVLAASFHSRWAWSERRWNWVVALMREHTDRIFWCEGAPPSSARTVADPHLRAWLQPGQGEPVPRIWADPGRRCGSFSQFWTRVQVAR